MLGVCYYPEHWPQSSWRQDARMMVELGLSCVRIGEFAWSGIEPNPGEFEFGWLDEAIDTLAGAGLNIVMCTPTATPPKWLVESRPEILPADPDTGRIRGFGSRRHYDFSSDSYLREALRISELIASRYGKHPAVIGWQTDNEFCCHDTALSGSDSARDGLRQWCREQYDSIDTLNESWGNVFWSMEYRDFSEIDLPRGAVTETNPAHQLAYRRYSSSRVVNFHRQMVEVIRRHSPGRFVTHNFIPMADTGVDNFALAAPLDFAGYDNYPLGRTELQLADASADEFRRYMRTGHPDLATYQHDQARCLTAGGYWVMEQQPGPVNWAAHNPRPLPGMIRFWTLEAFAQGADCLCYFRWRQAPFAQEQMHAGLLRPDNSKTGAWRQIEQVRQELVELDIGNQKKQRAQVAIVTSAESLWISDIEKQGKGYDFNRVQFSCYSALRRLGVDVDFLSSNADFSSYALVVVPGLPIIEDDFVHRCERSEAIFIFGPRSGAKTVECAYPRNLPPGPLQRILPLRVLSVETLREDCPETLHWEGRQYQSGIWREELDAEGLEVLAHYQDGGEAIVRNGRYVYQGTLTDDEFLVDFLRSQCARANIATFEFGEDIRVGQRGELLFLFNYSNRRRQLTLPAGYRPVIGESHIGPHDVCVWKKTG